MVQNQIEDAIHLERFNDKSPNPDADSVLAAVGGELRESCIRQVVIRYQGYGDSGSIEDVEYEPKQVRVASALDDKLRDAAANFCPDGYENNEGGYGTLTLHPPEGLAELEHRRRNGSENHALEWRS